MKIETTKTEKQIIEIPVPSFYKDADCSETISDLMGILDEKTIVKVYESQRRTCVQNFDTSLDSNDIAQAYLNWKPITEDEFFIAYNRALHSLSLTPELSKQH
jgi:hypothetical protein